MPWLAAAAPAAAAAGGTAAAGAGTAAGLGTIGAGTAFGSALPAIGATGAGAAGAGAAGAGAGLGTIGAGTAFGSALPSIGATGAPAAAAPAAAGGGGGMMGMLTDPDKVAKMFDAGTLLGKMFGGGGQQQMDAPMASLPMEQPKNERLQQPTAYKPTGMTPQFSFDKNSQQRDQRLRQLGF